MKRPPIQRLAILNALRRAGAQGVLNIDLNDICFRYGGRIFELRRQGFKITDERVKEGVWRYTLRSEPQGQVDPGNPLIVDGRIQPLQGQMGLLP